LPEREIDPAAALASITMRIYLKMAEFADFHNAPLARNQQILRDLKRTLVRDSQPGSFINPLI
jgi:hypothetical protein